jgi:hypothetical protein
MAQAPVPTGGKDAFGQIRERKRVADTELIPKPEECRRAGAVNHLATHTLE